MVVRRVNDATSSLSIGEFFNRMTIRILGSPDDT